MKSKGLWVWDVTFATYVLRPSAAQRTQSRMLQTSEANSSNPSESSCITVCSGWPRSDVTAAVLTASGRLLVTGRPPGLVHLVPYQQWPWNSIRWPHTLLHKQVRTHTLTAARCDQWARRCACDTLTEQSNRSSTVVLHNEIIPRPRRSEKNMNVMWV